MGKLLITTTAGRIEAWTITSVRKLIVIAFALGVATGAVAGFFVGLHA